MTTTAPIPFALADRTLGNVLRRRAAELGDKPMLVFERREFSYRDALAHSEAAAAALLSLGVGPGERVVLLLDNHPDYLWIVWGCALIGAVSVPLNTAAKGAQLAYYLDDADPALVVVEQRLAEQVERAAPGRRRVLLAEDDGGEWARVRAAADALPRADGPRFHDLATIMYTSGTTGPSKGVMCPQAHPLSVARYVSEGMDVGPDERMYIAQPLFHSAALWWGALTALYAGATMILARRFSASRFWQEICDERASWFAAVMSMVAILQKLEPSEAERTNPARKGFIIPVPEPRREFEERVGVVVTTNYAMSEIHPAALLGPRDGGYDKPGTAGRVSPHDEVRIVDDDDLEVPPGTVGEILVRPREPWSAFTGYWRKPEATAAAFSQAWIHTGDLASVDEDGFLFFQGRKKDAIRRRGENISAHEVEQGIASNPDVNTVAVVGVPSELGEQEVAAFVVPRTNRLSEADVVRWAADNMAYYMVPRFVQLVDALPETESFKIKKFELVARASEHRDRLWDRDAAGIRVSRTGVTSE